MFANAAFEQVLGLSRRSVLRGSLFDWFVEPQLMRDTVAAVSRNEFATSRLEAHAAPPGAAHAEPLPVHVIVNQMEARATSSSNWSRSSSRPGRTARSARSTRRRRTRS